MPHVNPFAVEGGLDIVVQQWAHDLWLWAWYRAGGFTGVLASVAVPAALAALLLLAALGAAARRPLAAPQEPGGAHGQGTEDVGCVDGGGDKEG